MFSHVVVGSNDLKRSKVFYDAIFQAMGAAPGAEDARGRLVYLHKGRRFLVSRPIDGNAASFGNGSTVGLEMDSPDQAKAWHAAGSSNGGSAIEQPPGIRHGAAGELFLAYLRDPDGNKLCAFHKASG